MSAPDGAQGLAAAVHEVEVHAAASGWDQPAQVFALVGTVDLLRQEPQLAAVLGIEDAAAGELTPVEQETTAATLEELLPTIAWPPEVAGCAVVVEATTLPPGAGEGSAEGSAEGSTATLDPETVAQHPESREARVVAGVLRTGQSWCAIRQREHDDDTMVMSGEDLVPALLELLHATFAPDPESASADE